MIVALHSYKRSSEFEGAEVLLRAGEFTELAQHYYGDGSSVEDALVKLQYDLYGIKHRSVGLDLKILWGIVLVVTGLKKTRNRDEE